MISKLVMFPPKKNIRENTKLEVLKVSKNEFLENLWLKEKEFASKIWSLNPLDLALILIFVKTMYSRDFRIKSIDLAQKFNLNT